jgi:hypothetical protein
MAEVINRVWSHAFVAASQSRFVASGVSRERREAELYRQAKDAMRDALGALVAWSAQKGMMGGPDASHLAQLVQDVCKDADMQVETKTDYDGAMADAKTLGKLLAEVISTAKKTNDAGRVLEVIDQATRFDRDAKDAYFAHVL